MEQEEQVLTGYRPDLVKRIATYAGPYTRLLVIALLCLVVATVATVLSPVIIQRTIDRAILDYHVRIRADERSELPGQFDLRKTSKWVYFREEELDKLTPRLRKSLIDSGVLDTTRYSVIDIGAWNEDGSLVPIDGGNDFFIITRNALESLSRSERTALRAPQIREVQRNAGFFLLVLLFSLAGSFGQVYFTAYTGQRIMRDLRIQLFAHTATRSLRFLNHQPIGRLVTRVTNDVETINELFTSVLAELVRNISLMIAVVITLFSIHARLAGWVLITLVPVIAVTEIFRRRARRAFRRVRKAVSAINSFLSEYISGMSIVQMFAQQDRSKGDFGEKNDELLHANLYEMYTFAFFRPIIDFLSTISTATILFFGARMLDQNVITIGVLIAFINLIRRFYMPVMSISEQFTVLQSALAGSERIFELLDEKSAIADTGTYSPSQPVTGRIDFSNVCFSYKEDEPVLRNLSFTVEPGQLVAVVGYTGAGKTTIINLLTRLWDIESGTIALDSVPIREWPLDTLRTTVQQIQQDVFVFNDSIRNNLTLGGNVSDETLWAACEAVQFADFVKNQPDGLDTVLTERGSNLSAGQRQLLSFARVLVHNPPILVLDEATSSIDTETESRLQKAVKAVTGGRTSLVIAHRLSTIKNADRILVLSHGELVESGTHEKLLSRGDLYATLYHLQFEDSS